MEHGIAQQVAPQVHPYLQGCLRQGRGRDGERVYVCVCVCVCVCCVGAEGACSKVLQGVSQQAAPKIDRNALAS